MNIFYFKLLILDKELSLTLPIGETELKLYNSLIWFLTNQDYLDIIYTQSVM